MRELNADDIIKCKFKIENNKVIEDSNGEFFNRQIALEICEISKQLNENFINSQPELVELYEEEIINKQCKIEQLKKEDEKIFKEKLNNYNLIKKSEIFKEVICRYELVQKENFQLKNQLRKNKELIKNLTKRLQISLNKYEELQCSKNSFKQIILNALINIKATKV
ncbi:MAG: hypothetical protein IKJ72_02235 [Mycoplasmataceae bacterium]|nr:hypothetical protein [Mycoplasmataceae bacterium]